VDDVEVFGVLALGVPSNGGHVDDEGPVDLTALAPAVVEIAPLGRTPVEGVDSLALEVLGVLALAVPSSGGRICADAAAVDEVQVAGRAEVDVNLCTDVVTAGELVLMLVGVDIL